jgi:hypothetical protein
MRSALLGLALLFAVVTRPTAAPPPTPVVVELFTSEGCSSCPPADALLERLVATSQAAGVQVIALGQHVDYWDRLGWKDRFSSAALTNRQQVYGRRFSNESIYTPQMVVDGRSEFVGSDAAAAKKAIDAAAAARHGSVRIALEATSADRIAVSVSVADLPPIATGDRADVIVAVTEDGLRSQVKSGENRGRTLAHAAVVRHMVTAGPVTGDDPASARAEIPIASDWQRENLKIVAFVQERRGRTILGSAAVPIRDLRR